MVKKEFKIGEEFQFGLVKLKCVKCDIKKGYICKNCFMNIHDINCDYGLGFIGECESSKRDDKENVIFVKIGD